MPAREALEALDRQGWQRSFHQRLFHDYFIRACARIFWKTEPPGSFARDHQKILEMNGWDHLSQEILVSTPRRFGCLSFLCVDCTSIAFLAEASEELLLRLWYGIAATFTLSSAARTEKERLCHHTIQVLPLHGSIYKFSVQGSNLPCFKREPTYTAGKLFWQGVGVVFHPPLPPVLAGDLADGVGGHWRREGVP